MDEVERCHRLAYIAYGKLLAKGSLKEVLAEARLFTWEVSGPELSRLATELREVDGIEKNLGMLATIGSVSPFVGLFGTVWGIMNSFSAIAARHDTTLAVVAPGIAEALFATAMGLLAAIPAVIFYNRFVAEIGRYVNQLDAFADEFSAILSRQLDEKAR